MDRFKSMVSDIKSKATSNKLNKSQPKMDMADGSMTISQTGTGVNLSYDNEAPNAYTEVSKQDIKVIMESILELKTELEGLSNAMNSNKKNTNKNSMSNDMNSLESLYNISKNSNGPLANINDNSNNNSNNNDNGMDNGAGGGMIKLIGKSNNELQISKMQTICNKLESIVMPYYSKKDHISAMVNSMDDQEFDKMLDEIDSKTDNNKDVTSLDRGQSDSVSEDDGKAPHLRSQLSDLIGSFGSDDNLIDASNLKSINTKNNAAASMDDLFDGSANITPNNLSPNNRNKNNNTNNKGSRNTRNNNNNNNNNNKKKNNNNNKNNKVSSNGESTFNLFGDEIHTSPKITSASTSQLDSDSNFRMNRSKTDTTGASSSTNDMNARQKGAGRRQNTIDNFWSSIDAMSAVNANTNKPSNNNSSSNTNTRLNTQDHKKNLKSKSLNAAANVDISFGHNTNDNNKHIPNLLTDSEKKRANKLAQERYEEIQKQFEVEDKEREERQQAFADHGERIESWEYDAKGVRRNLRTLLTTLPKVLWQDSGWKPISLANLVSQQHCKKYYRLACKLVHPDRSQQRGDSTERKAICERIFEGLNAAWDAEFSK